MPDIHFHCKHCKGKLVVDERAMGRNVACPECGEVVTIPLRSEDPVEAPKPAQQPQNATPGSASGNTCTRCGTKVIFDRFEIASKCKEADIPLNWGSMTPSLNDGSHTATGFNEILDLLTRVSEEKLSNFQRIVGSFAAFPPCPTCGELWCQRCMMGPMPYFSMGKKPHCKCG
jgi:predicted RNA-binding Zn-ribbon protein involved in translation (DUF1610 family)